MLTIRFGRAHLLYPKHAVTEFLLAGALYVASVKLDDIGSSGTQRVIYSTTAALFILL